MNLQRRQAALALAGAAGCLSPTLARANGGTLNILPAVADATIFAPQDGGTQFDATADGRGSSLWTSVLASGLVRRGLMRFDLSAIPLGAEVLEARVDAFMIRLREAQMLKLHRVTASWGEGPANGGEAGVGAAAGPGDVTWSHRFWPSQPWTTRGGDFVATASASTQVAGWPAPVTWNSTPGLVEDVQAWVNAPASNHGWMMIGTETGSQNATRLGSRENSTPAARPSLQVRWQLPVADGDVPLPPWALALLGATVAASLLRRRR